MTVIAEGKEAVLAYLEREAQSIAGEPGRYMLVRDDSGELVAFIAGRSFLGSGTYYMAGKQMVVKDAIVMRVQERQNA